MTSEAELGKRIAHLRKAYGGGGLTLSLDANELDIVENALRRMTQLPEDVKGLVDELRQEASAELEHVKHAATHGDIAMTQRYSRGASDKIAGVMDRRAAFRANKPGKPE